MAKSEFTCKLQIRRESGVISSANELTISVDGKEVYALAQDQLKATFHRPGPTTISVSNGADHIFETVIDLPNEHILLLLLQTKTASFLWRMLGAKPKLQLTEVSRKFHAAYDPGPPRELTSQIWLGIADSKELFYEFMNERDAYWSEENEEREGMADHIALSGFAEVMGETSYDHDFLEYGDAEDGKTLEERFGKYSYADQWSPVLRSIADPKLLEEANVHVQMGLDKPINGREHRQIANPTDVNLPGLKLIYLGEITHPSH